MAAKITMLAPTGSDEANIGTTRYHVDWRDNTIEAEPEHVQALIRASPIQSAIGRVRGLRHGVARLSSPMRRALSGFRSRLSPT
jgi:hypothetical protein